MAGQIVKISELPAMSGAVTAEDLFPVVKAAGPSTRKIKADSILNGWANVRWFGATGNGSTDDTTAIQGALNYAAANGLFGVVFPIGHYLFSRLYLHYDAALNANWPQETYRQGRIRLVGAGRMTHANYNNGDYIGTVLESTDGTGPAIYCNGDPLSADTYLTNQVQFADLSIIGANTTLILDLERVPENSGLDNVFIGQAGAGGGMEWTSTWLTYMRNVHVRGAGRDTSGDGIRFWHPASTIAGGFAAWSNVSVYGFNKGMILGAEELLGGQRMHSLSAINCQASACNTGVIVGNGIDQLGWHCSHVEGAAVVGMILQSNPEQVSIDTCSFVNCATQLSLGSTVNDQYNRYDGVTVRNTQFLNTNGATTTHLAIYSSSDTSNVIVDQVKILGDGTDVGLHLQDAIHHGLQVRFLSINNCLTEIENETRIPSRIEEDSENRSSRETGSNPLPGAPFGFRQGASAGAQPVIAVRQEDLDIGFMVFESPLADANLNFTSHFSKLNGGGSVVGPKANSGAGLGGWNFKYMMKVNMKLNETVKTVWVPLYESDEN